MTLQHPYCRTCGSHVTSKDVCNYCGCAPLKGHNYCCDCGTSTVAEAIMCVHCGAAFQRKFPVALAVLISIALAVSVAVAGYFIMQPASSEKIAEPLDTATKTNATDTYRLSPRKKDDPVKIINNIPLHLLTKRNDAIARLINNLPKNLKPPGEIETKQEPPPKTKEQVITPPEERPAVQAKVSMNVFSAGEVRSYGAGCTYYEGRSKNNIVFFTTNLYGYVKINGKVYALQGVQKGNDVAIFRGAGYDVTIEILGLAGSENDWVAEATMAVTDVRQRTLSRHKIYSSCIDF